MLPEEELPTRTRPAVKEDDLKQYEDQVKKRPTLDPEEIYREEERQVYDGRITGKPHSIPSSAAPVRTRVSENSGRVIKPVSAAPVRPTGNRPQKGVTPSVDKKAPQRKPQPAKNAPQSGNPPKRTDSAPVKAESKKGSGPVRAVIIAALCLLLLAASGFAVWRIGLGSRPVTPPETDAVDTNPTETDDVETASKETDPVETDPIETEPQETEPLETEPKETEPIEIPPVEYTVTVQAFGRDPVTLTTDAVTVGEFLSTAGFELTDSDRPSVPVTSMIESDMVIDIDFVEYKTESVTETLAFTAETKEVQTIPRGETNLIQNGADGEKTVTYQIEYINGVEVTRTVTEETITKEPVPEITELGVGGELVGADGNIYTYSYYRVVSATYYRIEGPTWYGHDASENTVATDFAYIPLGTKLYIKNDQYDFGVRTVEDTGSIEGYEVLIWLSEDNPLRQAFAENRYLNDMVIYYLD